MALETYELGRLLNDVMEEFRLDKTDADLRRKITEKINDAQNVIAIARPDWDWRLRSLSFDFGGPKEVTANVTQGSRLVDITSGAVEEADERQILVDSSLLGNTATDGYVIEAADVAGTQYTLHSQWLSATKTGKSLSIVNAHAELPDDFGTVKQISGSGALNDINMHYRTNLEFEKIRRKRDLVGLNLHYYTVFADPLGESDKKYLAFYPFIDTRMTVHLQYRRAVPELVNATDVPLIPRDHRHTLLALAYYYTAMFQKLEPNYLDRYQARAEASLAAMVIPATTSGEGPEERQGIQHDPLLVQMPVGYPDIRRLL